MDGGGELSFNSSETWQYESSDSETQLKDTLIIRNESVLVVAIGAVFVLAMRHNKTRKWMKDYSSALAISKNGRRQSCAFFDAE